MNRKNYKSIDSTDSCEVSAMYCLLLFNSLTGCADSQYSLRCPGLVHPTLVLPIVNV